MMAWKIARFVLPIRQPISQPRQLCKCYSCNGQFGPLRRWAESIKPTLQNKAPKFEYKLDIQRKYVQEFCISGSRNARSIFGVSVAFGAIFCLPRWTNADGLNIMARDYHMESFDSPEGEDDRHKRWMLMRKLWLPLFFLFSVFVEWDNPFAVAIRILLFLFRTKPVPLSIYLLVERLRDGHMHQKPHFYLSKPLYASKIDVQDYKLLCLARVEIGDQKLRLIGIVGGWWSLPSSLGISFLAQKQCCGSSGR